MNSGGGPLRARYIGYTKGTENHGDEALVWIIRSLLAPEIEVTCEPGQADIAILGGGTLINQSPWLIDVFEEALDSAKTGVVFGTGVGDPRFWGDHFDRWADLLNRCECVGVRGPVSERMLREHGVESATMIGDPYVALRGPLRRQPVPRRLGVNLGSTNDSLWGTDDRDLFAFIEGVLRVLKEQRWTFVWVSMWSKDTPELLALRERLGDDGPFYDARGQSLEALAELAGCEVFLGEKLHACAMAAVAGVPFVSLEYQPKVRDFAASLGMERWTVSTAERDAAVLLERIEEIRQSRDRIEPEMERTRKELRNRIVEFAERVRKIGQRSGPVPGGGDGI
jgi:polysaccharide pyruvyl transferase WcaK-like protein